MKIIKGIIKNNNLYCNNGCYGKYGSSDCKNDCDHCSHFCESFCPQD